MKQQPDYADRTHPRNLDNVEPLRLPEFVRPPATPQQPAAREPSFMEQFSASIRRDPELQIACTIRYMYFRDLVHFAKEVCELTEAPQGSDAEVLALKLAVKLDAWAETKMPPIPEPA